MCCHEFLARLLIGKDEQDQGLSHPGVHLQATERSVVPRLPMTGVLLGPSKSGKSTALVSMILEQYRGCFERIYIASASINVDDSWKPVKKYIEEVMKAPVDREQVYFEDWDEAALRRIINQQRKITETSKQLKMRSLYQILIVVDDEADSGYLNKKTGNSVIDTLFVRGRHFQISTLVSTQKLRLVSNAVRVNSQFFCVWRLRNQLEKDSLLEELTALVPKPQLEAMYEAAVAEPYSFLYIYLLNPAPRPQRARASTTLPNRPGRSSSGSRSSPGCSRPPWTPPPACPAQRADCLVEGERA